LTDPILADFRNFLFVAWKHLRLPPPTPTQYSIAYFMQHCGSRSMVKAFRGVGKSYIAAAYAIWCLLNNPHLQIIVLSASKPRADAFTSFCLRLINEMPMLAHLRPREGQRCSMTGFDVGPCVAAQTPSIYSIGVYGQLTGFRGDIIIPDDIEVPGNSETQLQREKLALRATEYEAVLKPDSTVGKIMYLGTDQCEDSTYKDLPDRGFDVKIWPLRIDNMDELHAYGEMLHPDVAARLLADPSLFGRSLEPDRWTDTKVESIERSYGRSGFALQFKLSPRLADADRYPLKLSDLMVHALDPLSGPEKLIWCGSPDHVLGDDVPSVGLRGDRLHAALMMPQTPHMPYTGVVMAVDPAGRGKDETGYAVVATLNGLLYVLDVGGLKGYERPTLEKLATIAKRYKVQKVIVEPNFGDGMFQTILAPVMAAIHPCAIEESERSNAQKEKRIIDTLEPAMSGRRVVVDRGLFQKDYDSTSHLPVEEANLYRLFYQLTRITREKGCLKHDDRLDALALAVGYWQKVLGSDVERFVQRSQQKALDKELKNFAKHVFGHRPRSPGWINHV
jgi:hypothetical protein